MEQLKHARVVPVIRGDAAHATATAERLLANGLTVVELTTTIPGWAGVLARLRADHPHATFGMGTVVTADTAREAIDAGADFLVSPWPAPSVRRVATIPFLEGGFTPGEIAAATAYGVAKLFPAHVGGRQYLKSLLAVLPGARIMPTGGIKLDEVAGWLAAGAYAVGMGSELADVSASRLREVLDAL